MHDDVYLCNILLWQNLWCLINAHDSHDISLSWYNGFHLFIVQFSPLGGLMWSARFYTNHLIVILLRCPSYYTRNFPQ